jgi:hypothetical protein
LAQVAIRGLGRLQRPALARQKLTTALPDRLTHHAHILTTRGPSLQAGRTFV